MSIKLHQIFAFCLAIIALVAPACFYLTDIQWQDFPDGYLTEFDHAEKNLFYIFSCISIAFSLLLLYLGWGLKKKTNKKLYFILFYIIIIIYTISIITLLNVDHYYYSHLDHGQGG